MVVFDTMERRSLAVLLGLVISAGCAGGEPGRPGAAFLPDDGPADPPESTTTGADPSSPGSSSSTGGVSESGDGESSTGLEDDSSSSGSTGGLAEGGVIYFNADGVTLTEGVEDATADSVAGSPFVGSWSPLEDERAGALRDGLETILAPFALTVTTTRPTEGPYTMIVATSDAGPQNAVSLATIDCGDQNSSNVVLAFDTGAFTTTQIVNATATSLGLAFGLARTEAPGDAMHVAVGDVATEFVDACVPLAPRPACDPPTLADGCAAGEQNSAAELRLRVALQ